MPAWGSHSRAEKGDPSPFEFSAPPATPPAAPPGTSPAAPPGTSPAPAGVLCIHGFTGTPFEMRYLGRRLADRPSSRWTVVGPVLPGHASSPDQLARTTWHQWYACVEQAFDDLRARCDRVAVVGQSLGGLLALYLAAHRKGQVAAVASLAAPLWLVPAARLAVRALRPQSALGRRVRNLPKLGGSDVRDPHMRAQNPGYRVIPVPAIHQLVAFMDHVDRALPDVTAPVLVVHARRDHTAPFACAERIASALSGHTHVQRVTLERSYHLVAFDVERDLVAAQVGAFLDPHLGRGDRRAPAGPPPVHDAPQRPRR